MRASVCGINTSHEKGKFCERKVFKEYGIFQFHTDFLYEKDNTLLRGKKGDLLIVPPQEVVYHGPVSEDQAFVNDWIYVEGEAFGEIIEELGIPCGVPFATDNKKLLNHHIKRILEENTLKYKGWERSLHACLTLLGIELFRVYDKTPKQNSAKLRVASVRETVLYNLQKKWTLNEMSALCSYSPSQFSAIYTKQFGISPMADLLNARLEKAEQLLKYTDFSITEIAEKCGFNSIYYFSKHFKENMGLSPSQARKRQ